ncbi:hypothetical protein AGABI2DRAFT_116414 [Agaricus bisporus var. bisporus H97]|uniref:hypothetical protein n=1 Tax=Agaricus bisporus var. bisporus (strain H97 / ATCC MYA-4626 / FGSC 10389) TaxID=936046 RepID=UPI00029F735E|nr:hypothetical protein AGABI2DRAFT_116414 [Agaricus bisporus var. bisporus H97]EKV49366.1 hypothetical protein AGABI2DRAFT_116414 [Agaricus bisporus var. bisporus H97]
MCHYRQVNKHFSCGHVIVQPDELVSECTQGSVCTHSHGAPRSSASERDANSAPSTRRIASLPVAPKPAGNTDKHPSGIPFKLTDLAIHVVAKEHMAAGSFLVPLSSACGLLVVVLFIDSICVSGAPIECLAYLDVL